jgi:hypothetical protein
MALFPLSQERGDDAKRHSAETGGEKRRYSQLVRLGLRKRDD